MAEVKTDGTERYCQDIDTCQKVKMILDKDFTFDWLYAEIIRAVCGKCLEGKRIKNYGEVT